MRNMSMLLCRTGVCKTLCQIASSIYVCFFTLHILVVSLKGSTPCPLYELSTSGFIMSTHKEKKEQFVSGLLGGSISEVYNVTCVALTAYLTFTLLQKYFGSTSYSIDFLLNKVTILLSLTLYSGNIKLLHMLIAFPGISISLLNSLSNASSSTTTTSATKQKKSKDSNTSSTTAPLLVKKPFLTAYRSHMIVITNLAILAVDFNIFPRRFAKVETWGTSLMDLGVGSFVFSMGLVNSRSIIKQYQLANAEGRQYRFQLLEYLSLVWKNIVKALPILALGLVRLVSVKSLEYQEHVTEYGIHWNFFFTLGFLPIVIAILDPFLRLFPRALVALTIGVGYEYIFNKFQLLNFVLNPDNRMDSIITQNKEGIISFIGYLSIFIFGQSFGSFVLTDYKTPNNLLWITTSPPKSASTKSKTKKPSGFSKWFTVTTTEGLVISTFLYQLLFLYSNESPLFNNISRRIANLPYVLWVVSYNSAMLLGYNLVELFIYRRKVVGSTGSPLLEAVNNNGLLCFLLGNLFTGLINMSINTLECSDATSFIVLCAYGAALTTILVVLDKKKIYIKL